MTLIAIHADGDHAQILTDTLSYTVTQRRLGRCSKVCVLPHVDGAVLSHGSSEFANFWDVHASLRAGATSFDELTDGAPDALRDLWREVTAMADHRNALYGGNRRVPRSIAFAVGYSDRAGRFRAVAHSSDDDFEPVDLDAPWIIPSPLDARPSNLELDRLQQTLQELQHPEAARLVARMTDLPALAAPSNDEEWAALARRAHRDRSLVDLYSGLKMYIGADVLLTRLERGASSTRRLFTFADSGPEWAHMLAGSLHPAGQLGSCHCGSGARAVECCLRALFDDPCPCGSGDTFAACCRVDVPAPAPAAVTVGRNDPCPCRSGKKSKRCCSRVDANAS